jgi:hypothetical protein
MSLPGIRSYQGYMRRLMAVKWFPQPCMSSLSTAGAHS